MAPPSRVGFNLLHLVPGETGGLEVHARRLVPALLAASPGLRLTLFHASEAEETLRAEPWAAGVDLVRIPVRARSRTRRVAAEQTLLPARARRARLELLHNLFNTAPAFPGMPQVTTIHDVVYRRFPGTQRGLLTRGLEILVPLAARRSRRVLTVSEAAKADIVRFLGVEPGRVDVTPNGPGMREDVEPVSEAELRSRLRLGDAPLVLTASAKRPHKNLERLIEAFGRLEAEPAPVLVVPGYATPFEDRLRAQAASSPAAERIRFAGWLDDAELDGLYRAATCFVLPSLAEGFGLPVLEAMGRGTPVACSSASSLPEVAGEAALYFDPNDTDAITAAITELLRDARLRKRLSTAGREQARKFTWERTARETLASYERALSAPRPGGAARTRGSRAPG